MKRIVLISIISLLIPFSSTLASSQASVPAKVLVSSGGRQVILNGAPVIVNDYLMLPLRETAEYLGIEVDWKGSQVYLQKGDEAVKVIIDTNRAYTKARYGSIFFMEQTPIVVNGRTMVSLRFVSEVLGADVTWDENHETISIADNGRFDQLPSAKDGVKAGSDKYYKLFGVLIGPDGSPNPDTAKEYVLSQGLLLTVEDAQIVHLDSYENITMVSGLDEDHQEKVFWLKVDKYFEEIYIAGSALNSGISKETAISIIKGKGIDEANIKTMYLIPCTDEIVWYVRADQDGKRYIYHIDFFTGDVYLRNSFRLNDDNE